MSLKRKEEWDSWSPVASESNRARKKHHSDKNSDDSISVEKVKYPDSFSAFTEGIGKDLVSIVDVSTQTVQKLILYPFGFTTPAEPAAGNNTNAPKPHDTKKRIAAKGNNEVDDMASIRCVIPDTSDAVSTTLHRPQKQRRTSLVIPPPQPSQYDLSVKTEIDQLIVPPQQEKGKENKLNMSAALSTPACANMNIKLATVLKQNIIKTAKNKKLIQINSIEPAHIKNIQDGGNNSVQSTKYSAAADDAIVGNSCSRTVSNTQPNSSRHSVREGELVELSKLESLPHLQVSDITLYDTLFN